VFQQELVTIVFYSAFAHGLAVRERRAWRGQGRGGGPMYIQYVHPPGGHVQLSVSQVPGASTQRSLLPVSSCKLTVCAGVPTSTVMS
jgi:hypothetical protein